jgi:hypothetical protein
MSWSVSSSGLVKNVVPDIKTQLSRVKLSDEGEQETVRLVGEALLQSLGTFDPERPVVVNASGSMGFGDWTTKGSPYQSYKIDVQPIHFSTKG